MASTMNKVILIGNIGRAVELRYTGEGRAVATLSIATSSRRRDKKTGQWGDDTQWHRVIALSDQAEWAHKELSKGRTVLVEGSIRYGSFERDGHRIPTVEIVATSITPFGAKRPAAGQDGQGSQDEQGGEQPPAGNGSSSDGLSQEEREWVESYDGKQA